MTDSTLTAQVFDDAEQGSSLWHDAWLRLKKNKLALFGGSLLLFMIVIALLTPWIENYGGGSINYNGIVTATSYHGNQVIGTPAGGFKSGAFTISNTDHTKDSINELKELYDHDSDSNKGYV